MLRIARELATNKKPEVLPNDDMDVEEDLEDFGWRIEQAQNKQDLKGKGKATADSLVSLEEQRTSEASVCIHRLSCSIAFSFKPQQNRTRLLKELSARLHRDTQLRYAEREMEMQKLLMGKGQSRKLSGVERIDKEDDEDEESDEDRRPKKVDEKTWKPRVYKWRLERKR